MRPLWRSPLTCGAAPSPHACLRAWSAGAQVEHRRELRDRGAGQGPDVGVRRRDQDDHVAHPQ
eukprot:3042596-Prymnesium_polylepis.1